ncbi:MAG: hypothetical protein FWF66_03555 [Candidatus Bathyarchaeota archaeon]|nr:hypothetical protein [Candidatus Termiticorpusculum sp.]
MNDQIFVINGNTLFMYDIATDTWSRKPDPPYYLFSPASTVVDNKIILIGNIITQTSPRVKYAVKATIYNAETDMWSEGDLASDFETSNAAAGATTGIYAPQNVYVFSGGTSTTLRYEPTTDTWSAVAPMTSTRLSFGVANIDDVLYVIGGLDSELETLSTNEQYIPIGYNTTPSHKPYLIYIIATATALVVLTVVIICVILLSIKKKRRQMKN